MTRTTLDIAAPILRELKRLQKREGKSLGELVSELLAETLRRRDVAAPGAAPFAWTVRDMGAALDLGDKERLWSALDRERGAP